MNDHKNNLFKTVFQLFCFFFHLHFLYNQYFELSNIINFK